MALFQTGSDAEIVEPDFRDSDDFYIKVQSVSSAIQLLPTQEITINVEYLAKRLFNGETLLEEVNKWAIGFKFKLIFLEGLKSLKNGFKRVVGCQVKDCKFKLIFKSNKNGKDFKLEEDLKLVHNVHTGRCFLPLTY